MKYTVRKEIENLSIKLFNDKKWWKKLAKEMKVENHDIMLPYLKDLLIQRDLGDIPVSELAAYIVEKAAKDELEGLPFIIFLKQESVKEAVDAFNKLDGVYAKLRGFVSTSFESGKVILTDWQSVLNHIYAKKDI